MLRTVILAASRSSRVERLVETAPLTRSVVRRFVAGNTAADALRCTRELVNEGLGVSLDYLGEDTTTPEHAAAAKDEYLALLDALAAAELTPAAEISVKLSALGQVFDEKVAYEHAKAICARAAEAGTTVTLDAEEHTTTDSTLDILAKLRTDFPTVGAVLQAYLRRTEADCREAGHRRFAGTAVQRRLQRARVGGLPVPARGGQGVRAMPEHPDVRPRIPDDRHP